MVPPPKSSLKLTYRKKTWYASKITVVIDRNAMKPYKFKNLGIWVEKTMKSDLDGFHYSVKGYEKKIQILAYVLPDLVMKLNTQHLRKACIDLIKRLARVKYKAIIVEADLATVKSPYSFDSAPPNAIAGSLFAIIARWGIPIVFANNRRLGEEAAASLLSKFAALETVESLGYPRQFIEGDI